MKKPSFDVGYEWREFDKDDTDAIPYAAWVAAMRVFMSCSRGSVKTDFGYAKALPHGGDGTFHYFTDGPDEWFLVNLTENGIVNPYIFLHELGHVYHTWCFKEMTMAAPTPVLEMTADAFVVACMLEMDDKRLCGELLDALADRHHHTTLAPLLAAAYFGHKTGQTDEEVIKQWLEIGLSRMAGAEGNSPTQVLH